MVFDVGANLGQTTRLLSRFFPGATIHSFEPVSSTFRELMANCGQLKGVHMHATAMGREPGRQTIRLQTLSELNSLRFPATNPSDPGAVETIEIETVAGFCEKHGIDRIDVLKIDAQGADLDVLQGAGHLLQSARVPFVLAEVGFVAGDVTNQPFEPLHRHLTDHGFHLSGFYNMFSYGARLARLGWCDALYVHPEALEQWFPDRPGAA
jgi:FkbM family methyltransferase